MKDWDLDDRQKNTLAYFNDRAGEWRKRAEGSEEHTSELQSRGLISYAVFCLKKQKTQKKKKK